jgi:flagellar hook-associated protein 1 FlgK
MTSFGTLNTAVSGLFAAQRALDVTGQNVVNANTPGYSRQRVGLASAAAATSSTFHSGNRAQFGGVSITDVSRVRDSFLEATRAAAGSRQSALDAQVTALQGAERLLAEPGESGLQQSLDDFFVGWQKIGTDGPGSAAGQVVINLGVRVADQLRAVSNGVAREWTNTHATLEDVVARANQAGSDLATLNGKIREGVTSGNAVNELLDRRDTLVRTLGELVGATAVPGADGQVSVSVNGIQIVSGSASEKLTLAGGRDISVAATDPPTILWGTTPVPVDTGAAAGQLAALRGDLPGLSERLDGVAVALRDAVNTVHSSGYASDGSTGAIFFDGTGARDLRVVPTDSAQLAVARSAGTTDTSVANRIGDLGDDQTVAALLGGPGPSVRWRSLTSSFGVQLQSLEAAQTVQEAVVQAAGDAVESSAGVNLDEEMTNMLLFQRAYQASARVITTVDEMLDTLINRTGIVGR